MARVDLSEILRLPVEERIAIAQEIWNSIAAEEEAVPVTPGQIEELQRRLEEHERDPGSARDADEVLRELKAKYGGAPDRPRGHDRSADGT